MGASVSKTSVDVVNDSIIQAITDNVNNCSVLLNQSQTVNLGGTGFFNSIFQSSTLNISCLQQVSMTNQLSTDIAAKIQSDATAKGIALLPSFSGALNSTNLANHIQTTVSTSTIQNCANSVIQSQTVNTSGIQVGNQVSQTLSLFSQCMQKALNNNNVAQAVVQDVAQTTTSTVSNPLDFLSGILSTPILIFIAIIVLIIVSVMIFRSFGSSEQSSKPQKTYTNDNLEIIEPHNF